VTARVFSGGRRVDAVAADDRGLAYGDGLFETMRVHRGAVPWWDAHWARLAAGARRLGLVLPDAALVRQHAAELFDDDADGVLKLLLTRGSGGRGYAPPRDAEPTWILSRHATPLRQPPLAVHWCGITLATQPALAGLKHCNRLEQVLARRECEEAGTDEGLLLDGEGDVVGGTAANLFVFRAGHWHTPRLDRCGVAGVCRAQLLPALQTREARITAAEVEGADAIFLCNAVRGILAVGRLGARNWPPHPAIAAARRALAALHPGFASDLETP
jgi:4-amino-4-deoxychorismate lyase